MRNRLLVAVSVVFALTACSRTGRPGASPSGAATPPGKVVVGVSLLTLANPFFKVMADAMQDEAQKHGFELTVTAGEQDAARQKDQIKDFIVRKVAAIVLCPCDSRSVGTSIVEANQAGIPVFTADIACLDKTAKVVSHIATDNLEGGRVAGKAVADLLKGKGKVAIIDHPEVESVLLRTKGFREVIGRSPGIQIVDQLPGGAQRDTAFKTAQDILEKHPDLDVIFAINDPTAFGALAAVEKAGRTEKVKIVGFDGMPEAKQAIKEGRLYADPIQFPDKIGQGVIQAVARYLGGESVPTQTLIPTALYTKAEALKDPSLK